MTLEEVAYEINSRNAILFAGAGFSYNSKNTKDKRPPIGDELEEEIRNLIDEEEKDTLENTSELFIEEYGVDDAIDFLKEQYHIKEYDTFYKELLLKRWKRIYTTNYDNLIDDVLKKNNPTREIKTTEDSTESVVNTKGLCLHINGSIEKLNRNNINDFFKLTGKSYLTRVFSDTDWGGLFQDDLENSNAIIIIGYSFQNDLDLKRFFFNLPRIKEKTIIISKPNEPPKRLNILKKYGTVLDIGVKDFSEKILAITPQVEESRNFDFTSFRHYTSDFFNPLANYDDNDIFKLFMYGELKESKLNTNNCYSKYIVRREKLDIVLRWISENHNRIILHSSLGNGKTVFISSIVNEIYNQIDCYKLIEKNKNTIKEYEMICSKNKKTVIVIEDYLRYRDTIEAFDRLTNPNIIFILSERTFATEFLIKNDQDYNLLNLDKLSKKDISNLTNIIKRYPVVLNFLAKKDEEDICEYIETKYRSNFQTFLVELLRSKDIVDRYAVLFNKNKSVKLFNLLNIIILNSFFSLRLNKENICYLLDSEYLYDSKFSGNGDMKELFKFEDDIPLLKSSILALELAKKINNLEQIFKMLYNAAQRAQKVVIFSETDVYFNFLKKINSFTNLKKLYSNAPNFQKNITDYFNKLQYIDFFKKNSHFWLQYAISKLDIQEIDFSEKCFDLARKYSKSYSHTQLFIDNHYSRLLLEKAYKKSTNKDEAFNLFKQAHELLINPIFIQQEWNYIFKVALNYENIYNKYFPIFEKVHKDYFVQSIRDISELLRQFKVKVDEFYVEERSNIKKCQEMVDRIIKSET